MLDYVQQMCYYWVVKVEVPLLTLKQLRDNGNKITILFM